MQRRKKKWLIALGAAAAILGGLSQGGVLPPGVSDALAALLHGVAVSKP